MAEHHSITAEIEAALQHSTGLVAYYSRDYTSRTACQYELTRAFPPGRAVVPCQVGGRVPGGLVGQCDPRRSPGRPIPGEPAVWVESPPDRLAPREIETLCWIAGGHTHAQRPLVRGGTRLHHEAGRPEPLDEIVGALI
jgi:hypothetical protein